MFGHVCKDDWAGADQDGFTLVEVVIVVMILGILAAMAAPRFVGESDIAVENAFLHSLHVTREAIDLCAANNRGTLPGQDSQEATFKSELKRYLRHFPQNPYGNPINARRVKITGDGTPLADKVSGDGGWLYDCASGEFIANSLRASSEGEAYFKY